MFQICSAVQSGAYNVVVEQTTRCACVFHARAERHRIMKIEKISSNKIKITVTNEDMNVLGITFESFINDSPERNELFRSLIRRAEFETGMIIDNSRLMIEASPLKYDGIVVFFTKLDSEEEFPLPGFKTRLRAKPKKAVPDTAAYVFDSTDSLLDYSAASKIKADGDLYCFAEKYYLILPSGAETDINISEYATKEEGITKAFLSEHGKLLIKDNALKTIDKIFNIGG